MDKTGTSLLATIFGSLVFASPIAAQVPAEAPADQGDQQSSDEGVAEIVVTAQRRSESGQDVPIAVAAFSAEQMERVGLATTADLPSVVPGLTISPGAARSPLFLRGVGNNTYSTSPSVLTFIDGVYQPFDASGMDFSNIRSIELAKGPQGTLFGRNATGGVLSITTKNPFDWQGVDAEAGYANYDTVSARLYGAAKLSDMVAADIAGFYYNQADGWGENVVSGKEFYKTRRYGVRSKWVAKLDDSFTATLTGDYSNRRGQLGLGVSIPAPDGFLFSLASGMPYTLPSIYDIRSEIEPFYTSKEGGVALTLEKQLGEIKLLSISSHRRVKEHFEIDFDGSEGPFIQLRRDESRKAYTQEFQASGGGTGFNWVTGLYYFGMNSKINGPRLDGIFFPVGHHISSRDRINAYAGYAQGAIEFLPETRLTLGARYTIEKRRITGRVRNNPLNGSVVIIPEGTQSKTFKKPSFRVALDHRFSPDVLAYASWNRGFNAGFFNQIAFGGFNDLANPLVKPEEIDAYEIGLKTDLLDRRLRVNISAFRYDYSNLQQAVYSPAGITTKNAASARIQGIDLDITARPVKALTLSVSANYLDTEYRSYDDAPNYDILPNGAFVSVGTLDAKGKHIVNAPKFGLQASATYTLETSVGTFDTTANLNHQAKIYGDPQNEFPIKGRTLIGLTEQWTSNDEMTNVTLWVKNLTKEKYDVSSSLLEPAGPLGNPGAPRTYGITLGRKF